ncbi:ABC transporter ATP-binding protein [Pengzhenrongella sicca]|uniref:ABC transporter ATP-binding protein n=1 Tax=Pengzhenrongella sicca TaxID=2819238 RepID=A0A8A4ZH41_9MICO|nr:ABC transporter ATP-binding protein [Pengzhenrongella sicca]QTE31194.1 ABC transporter ATP-binding protein [Pengzhenrongella sicca]
MTSTPTTPSTRPGTAAADATRPGTTPAGTPTRDATLPGAEAPPLLADGLTLAYDKLVVAQDLTVAIPRGSFTVIIGPNGCGKSTLLRALARTLTPRAGRVLLDGEPMARLRTRDVARRLALLPQSPIAPESITVGDLVARGRYPHQGLLRRWSAADSTAVADAMAATEVTDLRDRHVAELSGGQRQRAWLAMALAQDTDLLLLDEPTTFLDIAHQYEVMDLLARQHERGRTLVAVLHDLNQAARYASHVIAMRAGRVVAHGAPADVVTHELVRDVFGLECRVLPDPETGTPMVVPTRRARPDGSPRSTP